MEIVRHAVSGTLESSDILVEVSPGGNGVEVDLESIVMNQFGESLRLVIADVLHSMGVRSVRIKANDRGALECVVRARLETALRRGSGGDAQ